MTPLARKSGRGQPIRRTRGAQFLHDAGHVLIATAMAFLIVLVGAVARWGYIRAVSPRAENVSSADTNYLTIAAEVAITAATLEILAQSAGIRGHCETPLPAE